MLEKVKLAMRISTAAFDEEITALIAAGLADLGISDIDKDLLTEDNDDPLILRAVITYCRMNFGSPADYDRLKISYREQKAQLNTNSDYTDWSDD